jgi:adenylate kinase family enzyme
VGQIRRDQRRVLQEKRCLIRRGAALESGEAGFGDNPILVLTGPPGVGKTTAAALLAARSERAVHLESDAFFSFIRTGFVEPWKPESHEQNATVMRIVAEAAAGYASAGYRTIIDGIIIPGWFYEPLRDTLWKKGHAVSYGVLRAPLEVCLARVQGREGEPSIEAGEIEQLWRSFADLGELEKHVLEVDGMASERVSDELVERLSGASLRA